MDCNYTNQRRSQLGCPQFHMDMSPSCGCNSGMPPLRPPMIQPRQAMPEQRTMPEQQTMPEPCTMPEAPVMPEPRRMPEAGMMPERQMMPVQRIMPEQQMMPSMGCGSMPAQDVCTDTSPGGVENYPLAMAYVPWQQWEQTYTLDRGLQRGTIFPELDLPFVMGRCR